MVKRPPLYADGIMLPQLIAEHGFSALVDVYGYPRKRILFDTGISETGMLYNVDRLGIDLNSIDAIVLSHGHKDHFAGLVTVLKRIKRNIPLILHTDAFLKRFLLFPNGEKMKYPVLNEDELTKNGADVKSIKEPYIIGDSILVTGEITRKTDFEKGFPIHYAEIDGKLQPDQLIKDDQALVMYVKGKGIVVLTGCGHAGIINTIRYAKEITGIDSVYAVLGGFHLSGKIFEKIIEPTVEELLKIKPRYIIPSHCTGWKSTHRIAYTMPTAFIQNSVGTKFVFQ
tara:strand:+ start:408 stop:1259 length:852 start_codon:yes stop_codon:yes gene_type:complete